MQEIEITSWEQFEAELTKIEDCYNENSDLGPFLSPTLYRGQSDAEWPLKTTLERHLGSETFALKDYHQTISLIQPTLEAFAPRFPKAKAAIDLVEVRDFFRNEESFGVVEYMTYLRHYGFPSPLLDWSKSPYVAAFFAFSEIQHRERVAIFAYTEYTNGIKSGCTSEATIVGIGHLLRGDKRHYIQQSHYTICSKSTGDEHVYCSHEEAFERNDESQDKLIKFTIPVELRETFLSKLDLMNVNHYSLFQNEEALMKHLSYQWLKRPKERNVKEVQEGRAN